MKEALPPGATPLDLDEQADLIVPATTKQQLNEFEAQNIREALHWAQTSHKLRRGLLSVSGLCLLHKHMFGETWRWAGKFRRSDKNLGVDWQQVLEKTHALCGDAEFWIEHETWPWKELAVRFHHRLVLIHPFPNGNGRHARLSANLLLHYNGMEKLPWGGGSLGSHGPLRDEYIAALREADAEQHQRLVEFAQSST